MVEAGVEAEVEAEVVPAVLEQPASKTAVRAIAVEMLLWGIASYVARARG